MKDGWVNDTRVLVSIGATIVVGGLDDTVARVAGLPYPLTHLACFDREHGARIWIDASAIRVIETMREDAA